MDFRYRLSQLWHSVTARPLSQLELEEIADDLNPGEVALFQQMSNSDQRHAYRVYHLLKIDGNTDTELLAAALLHDVGKVRVSLSAWDRSLAVLGETFVPQRVNEWGDDAETGWKRTFVVRKQHARWGADLAADAGSRPGVVHLIMHHQDLLPVDGHGNDERLLLLQWADGQN